MNESQHSPEDVTTHSDDEREFFAWIDAFQLAEEREPTRGERLLAKACLRIRHDHAYPYEIGPHHCEGCDLEIAIRRHLSMALPCCNEVEQDDGNGPTLRRHDAARLARLRMWHMWRSLRRAGASGSPTHSGR